MLRQFIFSPPAYRGIYLLVLFISLLGLNTKSGIDASALQNPSFPSGERKVEILKSRSLPPGTPVAISAVRNLQSEDWLRNLEIEIQNTSNKPIYYLEIETYFPDLPKVN